MKNRKLKIAEFIDSIEDGQDSSLMTIQGGSADVAIENSGDCKNKSDVCPGSHNKGACVNSKNKCSGTQNDAGCTNLIPDPDSLQMCGGGVDFMVVCY